MCIIAYQPENSDRITVDVLSNCWRQNHDGAGYMFVADGQLVIRKPFYKLSKLVESYSADHLQHGATSPFVLHFRFATHGDKTKINVHPHTLANGDAGLVHNGILPFDPPAKSRVSDTVFFCNTVLINRPMSQLTGDKFNPVLGDIIGQSNKLVLMDKTGRVSIVNEDLGVWDGNYWFSNYGYLGYQKNWLSASCYVHDSIDDMDDDEWKLWKDAEDKKEFIDSDDEEAEEIRRYVEARYGTKFLDREMNEKIAGDF